MDMKEARRQAWECAYEILSSGTTPEYYDYPTGSDYARFERAWEEVLDRLSNRAGLKRT